MIRLIRRDALGVSLAGNSGRYKESRVLLGNRPKKAYDIHD
jgi:hypothetical protein